MMLRYRRHAATCRYIITLAFIMLAPLFATSYDVVTTRFLLSLQLVLWPSLICFVIFIFAFAY